MNTSLIYGRAGSGKTNYMGNVIDNNQNKYDKIIIVTKQYEPIYNYFENMFSEKITIYNDLLTFPKDFSDDKNYLCIFEGFDSEKSNKLKTIFSQIQHKKNIFTFYVSQSLNSTPKFILNCINCLELSV
jgi:hypothetical protein